MTMAILASIATLSPTSNDPEFLTEWLDACVLAHLEQGIGYEEAKRACLSHVHASSRSEATA